MTKTIAVHGATGSQGGPDRRRLRRRRPRRPPVTRASGADLLDRASLEAAYAGADAVVLTLPIVYDERVLAMAENAARAAEAAGVRQLVLNTSGPVPPERTGVPFHDARVIASEAAVPVVTVLAPTAYLENLERAVVGASAIVARRRARLPGARRGADDGGRGSRPPTSASRPCARWRTRRGLVRAAGVTVHRPRAGGRARRGARPRAALGADRPARVRRAPAPAPRRPRRRGHGGRLRVHGRRARSRRRPIRGPAIEALGWAPRRAGEWAAEVAWPLARV